MSAFLALAATAILTSLSVHAKTPKPYLKPINVTLTDNTPLLIYRPEVGDPLVDNFTYNSSLWNATWSDVPWSKWRPSRVGRGQSAHETDTPGNQVSVTWIGTSVTFLGSCDKCKLDLSFSGGRAGTWAFTPPDGDGVLASQSIPGTADNVEETATLTLREGRIALSGVVLTSIIPTYAEDVVDTSQTAINATRFPPLNVNPDIETRQGDGRVWSARLQIGSDEDQMEYTRLDTSNKGGYAQFDIPPKSTLVELYGSMNWDHEDYSVKISPPPKTKSGSGNFTYNGRSSWLVPNALLFTAPLDPEVNYTLRLENIEEGQYVDFHDARFRSLNLSDSKDYNPDPGLSGGAIAGIVIGCVAGVLIIAGLLWFLLKRRRDRHHYKVRPGEYNSGDERFEIDPTLETTQYTLTPATSQSNNPSTMGYSHFTPLGEESPESTLPPTQRTSTDVKAPFGLASVPLSPARSRHSGGWPTAGGNGDPNLGMGPMSTLGGGAGTGSSGTRSSDPLPSDPNIDYVTDTDAGPVRTQVLMPPSYNPEWAHDGAAGRRPRRDPGRMNSIVKAAKGL